MGLFPAFQYWVSGTALFLAGSFLFTVAVGLIGIRQMVGSKMFAALMVAAIVLSALAWRTAAKQEADSDTSSNQIASLSQTIKDAKSETKRELDAQAIKSSQATQTQSQQMDSQSKQLKQLESQNTALLGQNGLLQSQNSQMDSDIKKIAGAAHINLGSSPSAQDLADKILSYLGGLDARLTKVEHPPRDNNTLYVGEKAVARVLGIVQDPKNKTKVSFQRVSSSAELDFAQTFYFQFAALKCLSTGAGGSSTIGAEYQVIYFNVTCAVIGTAPS